MALFDYDFQNLYLGQYVGSCQLEIQRFTCDKMALKVIRISRLTSACSSNLLNVT
jgi:hypothetical protein